MESIAWHKEEKTATQTEYYVSIVDGEKKINFILKYNTKGNEVVAEPYSPPDINYTIHDGCDHENGECVLDDPDSHESQDVYMLDKYSHAINNLEKQLMQQRAADHILKSGQEKAKG